MDRSFFQLSLARWQDGWMKKCSTNIDLDVRGNVPELDQAGFEKAAQQAEQGCPISNALCNNVQIRVKAHLEK